MYLYYFIVFTAFAHRVLVCVVNLFYVFRSVCETCIDFDSYRKTTLLKIFHSGLLCNVNQFLLFVNDLAFSFGCDNFSC